MWFFDTSNPKTEYEHKTINRIGTMFLRPFLILKGHYKPNGLWPWEQAFNLKGQKKRGKKRIARQHKLNEGEERKVLWQLKRTFGVFSNVQQRLLFIGSKVDENGKLI